MTQTNSKMDPLTPLSEHTKKVLRERAEEKVKRAEAEENLAALTPAGVATMLHELRVHQAELELQNEELQRLYLELDTVRQRYTDLFDFAPVGYLVLHESDIIQEANLTAARMLGLPRKYLLGKPLNQFTVLKDKDALYLSLHLLFQGGDERSFEVRLKNKDGKLFDARLEAATLDVDKTRLIRLAISDISRRKQSDAALRQSEAHLEEAQRIAHVGSWDWLAATDTPTWSTELCRILGVDPTKPVPSMAEQDYLYTPDSMARMRISVGKTMRTGEPYEIELEHVRQDGSRRWLLARGEQWRDEQGKLIGLRGTALDITDRKQAEGNLNFQAHLLASMQDAVIGTDMSFAITHWNATAQSLYGWAKEEVLGHPLAEFIQNDYLDSSLDEVLDEINSRGFWKGEVVQNRRDGIKIPIQASVSLVTNHQGQPIGFVAVNRDISERNKAEEVLRESEERLSQALLAARGGAWEWDIASNKVFWSDENYRLLGLDPQSGDTTYETWLKAVHPDDRAVAGAEVFKAVETQRDLDIEFRVVCPDGTVRWINDVGTFIFDKEGNPSRMYGVQIDITERKKAEETLRQSHRRLEETLTELKETQKQMMHQERLAVVGQMAAGIAHDFNNILAIITLYSQTTMLAPGLTERDRERIVTINEQAWRASHLVQQILDFSRKAMLQMQPIRFSSLLQNQVNLLKRTLPEHIKIQFICESDGYTVNADQARMQQMITNLAVNARDAMPEGGNLSFELRQVVIAPGKKPPMPEMASGVWLHLSISDTGEGILPEVLPHIFEPFFTTKGPGEGSGLGLAQVYGIVGQHDGYIDVETKEGKGTVFHIFLPALESTSVEVASSKTSDFPRGKGELVLVVEDNKTLREALSATLMELNYRTAEAANGRQGLALLEEMREQIALVLSDVIMPEMGGKEFLLAIKALERPIPVIFISGHTLDETFAKPEELGLAALLTKPPSFESLAIALDSALRK